jgi:hypothetical protein
MDRNYLEDFLMDLGTRQSETQDWFVRLEKGQKNENYSLKMEL